MFSIKAFYFLVGLQHFFCMGFTNQNHTIKSFNYSTNATAATTSNQIKAAGEKNSLRTLRIDVKFHNGSCWSVQGGGNIWNPLALITATSQLVYNGHRWPRRYKSVLRGTETVAGGEKPKIGSMCVHTCACLWVCLTLGKQWSPCFCWVWPSKSQLLNVTPASVPSGTQAWRWHNGASHFGTHPLKRACLRKQAARTESAASHWVSRVRIRSSEAQNEGVGAPVIS